MENKPPDSTECKLFSKAFRLLGNITFFLKQAEVNKEHAAIFDKCIDEFEYNVIKLFEYGKHTFLKDE